MAMLDSFESSSSLDINLKQDDSVYGKIDGGEKYVKNINKENIIILKFFLNLGIMDNDI